MTSIPYETLLAFTDSLLGAAGLDDFSRRSVTVGLCETSLRGVDSHGIRLLPHYTRSALSGRKNPRPDFRFQKNFPAIGLLDADNAFGHAAGFKAVDLAMEMAESQGMGAVGVANSSHPGAMASFALHAARAGFICFAYTHADALLLSHGGVRPFFGTNPICMAAPRREAEPYCLDMATSIIPWNRALIHRASNSPLPEGVAADAEGSLTTDPNNATCLIPTGGYKGQGLASMVEILCGVMTGMAFGREIPAMYKAPMESQRRLGQFYLVMRADGCVAEDFFLDRMQALTDAVRNEPAKPGQTVMLAGDKENREADLRRVQGIPLDPDTVSALTELAGRLGVAMPIV